MKRKFALWVFACFIALSACVSNGPQSALDKMARAMDDNNVQEFMAGIDLSAYTENYLKNLTNSDMALSSLNELGNMLGIGGLDKLIGSLVDARARIKNEFERGVASGELMAQCAIAITPDCPWYPSSLRQSHVVELGPDTAIARVTTPARITSWLAMRKRGEQWQVVGRAVMEDEAREMAEKAEPQQTPSSGAKSVDI